MTLPPFSDFDIDALYFALDTQRRERGLNWRQAVGEISRQFDGVPSKPINASTVSGIRGKRVLEGDGVLQMLRWLGRTPESFVPGCIITSACTLPDAGMDRILRFDTKAMYLALDAQRMSREMTWKEVADEIGGIQAASLTRLAKGGRTGFPVVMRIARWLGRTAASLTYMTTR